MTVVNPPPLPDKLQGDKVGTTNASWTRWFQDLATKINKIFVSPVITTSITIPDNGLKIKDESGVYTTTIDQDRTLTANRTFNILTADSDQTVTFNGATITLAGSTSGTNTGDQTITLTGDVTGSGTGSFATTLGTVPVTKGGTNVTTFGTAYAPICSGTTATGSLQIANSGQSTSGYVWTSTGSSSVPTFQKLPYVLLDTQTASSSASVTFSGTITGYTHYLIMGDNIRPATNNTDMWIQVSTDSGSTWKTGGSDYAYQLQVATNTTLAASQSTAAAQYVASTAWYNGATNYGVITLELFNPAGGAQTNMICKSFYIDQANAAYRLYYSGGRYLSTTTVNGIKILMSSGNLTSGTFKLYGIQ